MAACRVDTTKSQCTLNPYDPSNCQSTSNFICRLIRLCTPTSSNPDPGRPVQRYAYCSKSKNPCKVNPQERLEDQVWLKIREEAESDVTNEPILSKYYDSAILSHGSLESALANHLAIKLCNEHLSKEALYGVFLKALVEDREIQQAVRADIKAVKEQDPACLSYAQCLLNFKGFLACQAHRLAHRFWLQHRNALAFIVQNQVSQVFGVDIHPGAKIGRGIVLDHGTGIVIGETAVVGNNVTILHDVTLGGTGKTGGDRHPKIGDGVMIGAGAKVLGNIQVGESARIGAGSVVLKEVPPQTTAVGNPARLAGFR